MNKHPKTGKITPAEAENLLFDKLNERHTNRVVNKIKRRYSNLTPEQADIVWNCH